MLLQFYTALKCTQIELCEFEIWKEHTRYDDQIFAFQMNSKRRLSLPNPGGDGFVVVENWSAASQVHGLPILVDHVVVHSGNRKGRKKDEFSFLRKFALSFEWKPVKHGKLTKTSHSDSSDTSWYLEGVGLDVFFIINMLLFTSMFQICFNMLLFLLQK